MQVEVEDEEAVQSAIRNPKLFAWRRNRAQRLAPNHSSLSSLQKSDSGSKKHVRRFATLFCKAADLASSDLRWHPRCPSQAQ